MHENHRARTWEKIKKFGYGALADHELLEVLLYYPISRQDTNPRAHELLERFGSLRGICGADLDELMEVDGIGEKAAMLLMAVSEMTRRCAAEAVPEEKAYDSVSKIAQYFISRCFIGTEAEYLFMLLLNNRMGVIDCVPISKGSVNLSAAPVRVLVETALKKKASTVVLAHNHPNGLALPSGSDLEMTDQFREAFELIGVTLLEHLIIAEDRFYPIMKMRYGNLRRSPVTGLVESGFYDQFYDVDHETWKFPPIFGN